MMIFDIEPCDCNDWPVNDLLKEDGIWVTPPSEINKEIRDLVNKRGASYFKLIIQQEITQTGHYYPMRKR